MRVILFSDSMLCSFCYEPVGLLLEQMKVFNASDVCDAVLLCYSVVDCYNKILYYY